MTVLFSHVRGAKEGQAQEFDLPIITLGRDSSCHVQFDPYQDLQASGRHAEIRKEGDNYFIYDLNSTNGTYVNQERVTRRELKRGDLVSLGRNGPQVMVSFVRASRTLTSFFSSRKVQIPAFGIVVFISLGLIIYLLYETVFKNVPLVTQAPLILILLFVSLSPGLYALLRRRFAVDSSKFIVSGRPKPGKQSRFKTMRRLEAIMFTDMVGFSASMGQDERLAIKKLEAHNRILEDVIADHGGHVIKTMGDAFMANFESALTAVDCAKDIQRKLGQHNTGKPDHEKLIIRIGIHLGDVIIKKGDFFGDAVNIAARLEPKATPGGICVSRPVYDQLKNNIDIKTESMGSVELKNIKEPLEIYRVLI
jgi:class 3 adenylate cyclase